MTKRLAALSFALMLGMPAVADDREPPVMTPRDLMSLPVRQPDRIIPYGNAPSQFGELRLPRGKGPHPLVVLIHGGCWSSFAGARSIGAMADALKDRGIATWNIEYRRLPEAGSGWPGTYADTAKAIDHVRTLAPKYRLDLTRTVFLGHSAGGHLAHWAAGRRKLKPSSPLYVADPLVPAGIINLAGRMDMTEGIQAYEALCHGPVVRSLLGGMPDDVPERYADASPARLLPLGVPQIMIWGSREDFVPKTQVDRFVVAARAAGDDATLLTVNDAGHFETASPRSTAWPVVLGAIERLLAARPR